MTAQKAPAVKSRTNQRRQHNRLTALGMVITGLSLLAFAAVLLLQNNLPVTGTLFSLNNKALPEIRSVVPAQVRLEAPHIALTTLDGKKETLADYHNQVVLINNWAIWCPPCKAELPHLEAYYQAHKDEGFVILGIEAGGSSSDVRKFIQTTGVTYPIWLDPQEETLAIFRNASLPSSYVVDRNGQIVLAWTGTISLEMLERHVTPLLSQ